MLTELAMTTSATEIVPYSTPRRRGVLDDFVSDDIVSDDIVSDDFVSFIVAVFVVVGPHILIIVAEINDSDDRR